MNILWDFDGTLFDTYPSLVDAFIALSGEDLDRDEVLRWLKIDSKTAFRHYGIDESRREDYKTLYHEFAKESAKPFEGLEKVLANASNNVIVTHRDRPSTMFLLEKFGLDRYFTEVVAVEEQGFIRKPHAASYQFVMETFPIDLVIGDRDLDLIPARELGIRTVAFQNNAIEADVHISSYGEFADKVIKPIK